MVPRETRLEGLLFCVSIASPVRFLLLSSEHSEMPRNASPLEFRVIAAKGRAVFAARDITAGEHLIVERPLLAMALPESRESIVACEKCCRPVGTIALQLCHLTTCEHRSIESVPLVDDELAGNVPCRHGCAARFCSTDCEDESAPAHALLCSANRNAPAKAALARFEKHAFSTHETFLFGARMVASAHVKGTADLDQFCCAPWWEISEEGMVKTPREVHEARDVADESRRLLLAALPPASSAKVKAWLSLEVWGGMLGAARRNALCVSLTHPVDEWAGAVRGWRQQLQDTDGEDEGEGEGEEEGGEATDAILEQLPMPMPDALWTALYARIACVNHDCSPNAEVHWLGEGSEATLLARRAIPSGAEISITYIDDNERVSFRERRASLRDYGFECACAKCTCEEGWTRRLRPRRE